MRQWLSPWQLVLTVGTFLAAESVLVYGQAYDVKLPVLSLTGSGPGYDQRVYPAGFVVVPEQANPRQPRELLVPVYIRNCWVPSIHPVWGRVWPIYSFEFKLKYDGRFLEFLGLQKVSPTGDSVLAKDFTFAFDDVPITAPSMLKALVDWHNLGSVPAVYDPRRVRIAASSAKPLPPSPAGPGQDRWDPTVQCDNRQYVPIIYLRFRVTGVAGTEARLILSNDTLMYNDLNLSVFPAEPFPTNLSGSRYRDFSLPNGGRPRGTYRMKG
ncbi:MAG: hypothetical protein RMK93_07925 [Bacteroidota bacterium]|nr:hypothetical protein [Bacteroidota bacterium]